MTPRIKILAAAIPAAAAAFLSILIIFWRCRSRRRRSQQQLISSANRATISPPLPHDDMLQSAIDKFHNKSTPGKNTLRFHQLHHSHNIQKLQQQQQFPGFNWDDTQLRPISDVLDHGWTQFVFQDHHSSTLRSSPLWSLCARSHESPQIALRPGASESMQTVRLNPVRPKSSSSSSPLFVIDNSATCYTRMSLPLPGPSLIDSSFPQEAYFEITILRLHPPDSVSDSKKRLKDGAVSNDDDDHLKLIEQNPRNVPSEEEAETKITSTEEISSTNSLICLGLTRGGSTETKLIPGTYPGSIGFQSNGSVCLDGMKLVSESNGTEWARVDRVIGCGFNPSKKNVFFTLDSELAHVIRCHSETYKSPLYPILVSNSEVTVLVNLGQAAFKYAPANAHRTTNPRFLPLSPSNYSFRSEDSREFFSMEIPDTECLDYAVANSKSPSISNYKKKSKKSSKKNRYMNWDQESVAVDLDKESDLFEIALNY